MNHPIVLPPEWHAQSAIQLTWPHHNSDWRDMLAEVTACYVALAQEILKRQTLIVVCANASLIRSLISQSPHLDRLLTIEVPTNDTWARDHGGISILVNGQKRICDFGFNGWGLKFAANYDNQINRELASKKIAAPDVQWKLHKNFILEGGAIESDGKGTLLTTSECLLSPNRNPTLSKEETETALKTLFGLNRVLWLDHGYLEGDDTDSHIDTLARFCNEHTIAYVQCTNRNDAHYQALLKMEEQLKTFVDYRGNPYTLVALPMAKAVYNDAERLPATYANFLIMNDVVLIPLYNDAPTDQQAMAQLQTAFPTRQVIGIDCTALIYQHGSLHCATMQYPEGFINE